MSTTDLAPAPTLTNAGTTPATPRKLFVSLPVEDLQRSITFFEALGFTFNAQFTDATATCMLVGEDAYVMLLTRERFQSFTPHRIGHPNDSLLAGLSISADSRSDVDTLVEQALASGGASAGEAFDHGFMYSWSFRDPDGYPWDVYHMDPITVQN